MKSLKCALLNYLLRLYFLYDTILAFKIKHIYIEQDEMIEKDEFFEKTTNPSTFCRILSYEIYFQIYNWLN